MYRVGWFSTGRDVAARQLLTTAYDRMKRGDIAAQIAFVFCNRDPGEAPESDRFLALVREYRLPLVCFSWQKFLASGKSPEDRLEYDREVTARLQGFQVDLCLLAGYMLIVGREMCQRYDMINLHPAAPGGPTGTWQEVIWKLINSKASRTGVMMHLVTPELDRGPVVTFCTFTIRGKAFDGYWKEMERLPRDSPRRYAEDNRLFRLIREHGVARELPLMVATLKAFSEGRVHVTPDKLVIDSIRQPTNGYDLTEEIDRAIGASGR